ncbi:ERF family protein [Enterococcus dongliensis]|uniref:ERF family protein n=1 Tax=Enterococcus dongliensis TaxID=2559925 RepID=UPI0028904C21|nr:ERF family protein [Enterococcus dongliensis]MDT2640424.1 ERF family protein [Enterococcus dongliensis]
MRTSNETKNIFKALADFREVLKQPSKDANNPFFKSTYVTLDGVVKAIDEAIKGTGLSYSQEATSEGNQISVSTHVFHTSGEFISYDPLTLPTTKADAQAFGSAVTYAKRYALGAVFGVTSDVDDDGNKTSGKNATNNTGSNKSTKTNTPPTLSKVQLDTATNKLTEFANTQGINLDDAVKKLFPFLKIKSKLANLTPDDFGVLMNYLNQH